MRRGGKRMDMIRPHLEQQRPVNDEDLYSESDQEAETQSRTSAVQVLCVCLYKNKTREEQNKMYRELLNCT